MKSKQSLYDWCIENNKQYLLEEWDYEKNELTPKDYAPKRQIKVWWKCKRGHSWETTIANRSDKGHMCKECRDIERKSKTLVYIARPELMNIWDYERNGKNTPYNTTISESKEIWWYCSKCDSSWSSIIRNKESGGCPFCTGHKLKVGYNDLETWAKKNNPSILKMYSDENIKRPNEITFNNAQEVIWHCPKFDYSWKASVNQIVNRWKTINCFNCDKSNAVINQNNISCGFSLKNRTMRNFVKTNQRYQDMKKWWAEENKVKFLDVGYGVGENKFIWKCPIGHTFERSFNAMYLDISCPICSKSTRVSFSELLLGYELKKCYSNLKTSVNNTYFEWLGKMSFDIYIPKYKIVIEYDGPRHSDKLDIDNRKDELCKQHGIKLIRVRYKGLPQTKYAHHIWLEKGNNIEVCESAKYIVNLINQHYNEYKVLNIDLTADEREVSKEFYNHLRENSLGEKYPELAKEFDIKRNGGLNPYYIPFASNISYWWYCEKCDSSWEQTPNARTQKGHAHKCPYCNNDRVREGFNDIATTHPQILIDWDYTKNEKLPTEISYGSQYSANWVCHNCGHEWKARVGNRIIKKSRCPVCFTSILD